MGPRGVNVKVQAAKEKKAANDDVKSAKDKKKQEEIDAKEWSKGGNLRGQSRAEAEAAKTDEALRKKREKAELMAQEEEATSGVKVKKVVGSGMKSKQKKKKGKDDLSFLEDSLVSAADKKIKASIRAKKEKEERLKKEMEAAAKKKSEEMSMDPLMSNTASMLGIPASSNDVDNGEATVGRKANRMAMEAGESGVDGALRSLQISSGDADTHPEKRMKALHKEFEERMMPEMKQDYPGLKMSQYKEKIFNLWKKSKENPMNQQQ